MFLWKDYAEAAALLLSDMAKYGWTISPGGREVRRAGSTTMPMSKLDKLSVVAAEGRLGA